MLKRYRWEESPYVPLIVGNVNGKLGTINIGNTAGGVNWPGSAFDPETGWFYTQASNSQVTVGSLAPPPRDSLTSPYQPGVVGQPFRIALRQAPAPTPTRPAVAAALRVPPARRQLRRQRRPLRRPAAPLLRPDAAVRPAVAAVKAAAARTFRACRSSSRRTASMAAIDVNKGDLVWQVPHGDTPDNVRNHPALKGLNIPKTGQNGSVGTLVTKTLVIAGDPGVTSPPGRPRGAMLHAYDKKTGAELGAV